MTSFKNKILTEIVENIINVLWEKITLNKFWIITLHNMEGVLKKIITKL